MPESCTRSDLVGNFKTMLLLWGLPVAIMLATGYYNDGGWITTIGWTLSLSVMGAACLVNARGCGRIHCYFTGPFFVLMAVTSLLHGARVLLLGPHGWHFIGIASVVGGALLYFVPERIWGRYRCTPTATPSPEWIRLQRLPLQLDINRPSHNQPARIAGTSCEVLSPLAHCAQSTYASITRNPE